MSRLDPFDDFTADLSSASEDERLLREQEDEQDLRWLITDARGRRFLRRHLGSLGVFRSSYTGEALSTAFREGERNAGLRLFHQALRIAPAEVAKLLTEENNG